jgi:hypothetical protein
MAEFTRRSWNAKYTNPKYEDQKLNLENADLENLDFVALNTFVIKFIYTTEITNNMDTSLFREFQEQFQNWTTKIFAMCHKTPRTELHNVFKNRGVYTFNPIPKINVSKILADFTTCDKPEWP